MPNTVGPSPVRCSLHRMARRCGLADQLEEPPLALDQRQAAQVIAVMLQRSNANSTAFGAPLAGNRRA